MTRRSVRAPASARGRATARARSRAAPCRCARRVHAIDFRRRAGRDDLAAGVAAFGTEVDHPVGCADHVEVVLDHDQRMAGSDQLAQAPSSFAMSSKCRPVVGSSNRNSVRASGSARAACARVARALRRDGRRASGAALRRRRASAPAGRACRYSRPTSASGRSTRCDFAVAREERERFGDRHLEHVGDRAALDLTSRISSR